MKVRIKVIETREYVAELDVPAEREDYLELFVTDSILDGSVHNGGEARTIMFETEYKIVDDGEV